jgi:hypothetical protein
MRLRYAWVGIRRRLVEQQVKYAARMKVACVEGLEFAGRMFEVQHLDVEGLTEDEIKVMKVKGCFFDRIFEIYVL